MQRYTFGRARQEKKGSLAKKFAVGATAAVILGGAGLGIGEAVHSYYHEDSVTATIHDKAIKRDNNKDIYMLYTDKGVFTDHDSLVKGKFDSSDVYGALKEGCTYKFNKHGWRVHILSSYENVDKATPVPTKACPTP